MSTKSNRSGGSREMGSPRPETLSGPSPWMERLARPSALALLGANVVPLVGVIFFGWDLRIVMLGYWAESAVIGFYNVLRMVMVGGIAGVGLSLFFMVHYGGFMAGHLVFILGLTGGVFVRGGGGVGGGGAGGGGAGGGGGGPFAGAAEALLGGEVLLIFAGLMVSHGVSFVVNFLGRERAGLSAKDLGTLMGRPYGRIIVMHLTLIAGAFVMIAFGAPVLLLVLLVLIKTAADLGAHLHERKKLEPLSWGTE